MATILEIIGSCLGIAILIVAWIIYRRRPGILKPEYFSGKWQTMQRMLANKTAWKQAVIDADKLLDEALKKKKFPGKSMGERLTKAQRLLSDNESVWFGHKLRKQVEAEPTKPLKEKEVKRALVGIRQALKDLGALPDGK